MIVRGGIWLQRRLGQRYQIGDATGVDKAVQAYLFTSPRPHRNVAYVP